MVEIQIFLEGFFATMATLAGDFLTSVGGLLSSLGNGIRGILSGIGT